MEPNQGNNPGDPAQQPQPPQPPQQPLPPQQQPQQQPQPLYGSQGGQQPPYGTQPPGAPQQPEQPQKTNTLAIVALISAFFVSILGIILGHISLGQIKKSGEGGRGLALAGTILGYIFTFVWIIVIGIFLIMGALFSSIVDSASSDLNDDFMSDSESSELFDTDESDEWLEDDFNNDSNDDFNDEEWDFEDPWIGTEYEEFCSLLMNAGMLTEEEEQQFFQDLAKKAPTPEGKAVYEEAAKLMTDDHFPDDEEIIAKIFKQVDDDFNMCLEL